MKTFMLFILLILIVVAGLAQQNNTTKQKPTPTPTPTPKTKPTPGSGKFQILVDVNQIEPAEAEQAARFAADGIWAITINSDSGIDWPAVFAALHSDTWTVAEDNPGSSMSMDLVSAYAGRLADSQFAYIEGVSPTGPTVSAPITIGLAGHQVPHLGPVGPRITVLCRNYADSGAVYLNYALGDPNVSGAAFEFWPENLSALNIVAGARAVLGTGRRCYLLLPPGPSPWLASLQWMTEQLPPDLIHNSSFYIVPAIYLRQSSGLYFAAKYPGDPMAVETAVEWLIQFRNSH